MKSKEKKIMLRNYFFLQIIKNKINFMYIFGK